MSEMIISMDYTASRLDFFKEQKKLHEQKLHWWKNQKPYKQYGPNTIHQRCSDHGAAIAYYEDAINALAYIQQLEDENEAYKHAASKCCYESRCNAQIKELETLGRRLMDEKKQLVRERDAAVADICKTCSTCKHYYYNRQDDDTADCLWFDGCKNEDHWEWRGAKEE